MSTTEPQNHDPEPWVTEDGKRQNTSVVPYRLGGKTYADYDPRPEYTTRDPQPWVSWGVRYATQVSPSCYWEPRSEFDEATA